MSWVTRIEIYCLALPPNHQTSPMKSKFFMMLVLFMSLGAFTFAQTQAEAPAEKKDAPAKTINVDQQKSTDCPHHQAAVKPECKVECKWVDADKDGICDTCGKKDCKEKCKTADGKKCDPAACTGQKAEAMPSGCCSAKGGKK